MCLKHKWMLGKEFKVLRSSPHLRGLESSVILGEFKGRWFMLSQQLRV